MGVRLAHIHNQPLSDMCAGTLLNGQYLYSASRVHNMPFRKEIHDALEKTDTIIRQVTDSASRPFVRLWNQYETDNGALDSVYGNPAWDLGIVINSLEGEEQVEDFLRQYLSSKGVQVTVIELYAGVLYAKLKDTIANHYETEWQRLAENECDSIVHGNRMNFKEIPAEVLSHLGLPGLCRAE